MDWIEKYIYEVLRHIPVAQKNDIEKEIRGMIAELMQEQVEKHSGSLSDDPDLLNTASEDDIKKVLETLGDPRELARQYRGNPGYVIGPALYDTYWLVVKIVLLAVGIGLVVAKSIQIVVDRQMDGWDILVSYLGIAQGLISAFAMVTLIFISIEHFGGDELSEKFRAEKRVWKLGDLPEIPQDKLRIKRGDPIASVVFTIIFLVIINVYPQLFGFYQQTGTGVNVIGFLGDAFRFFLVWINLALIFGLILEAVKIAYGRWTFFLVAGSLVQNVFSLIVGILLVRHPSFINPGFISAVNNFLAESEVNVAIAWQDYLVTAMIVLIVFGFVVETITLAAKGFRLMQAQLK